MVPELAVHQRGLVDRKILFADSEVEARYILPFVDRRWKIPFAVLDLREGRPLVFDGPFRLDRFRFRTVSRTDELRPIESVSLDELRELAHFDPWWVFRRSTGVQRPWVEAVFATNIARPWRLFGRTVNVSDLAFSSRFDRLEEIWARGPMLRSLKLRIGEVDLFALRSGSKGETARPRRNPSKAL